jgi:regulatory protein
MNTQQKPPQRQYTPKKARRITPEYLHNAALYYLQRYAATSGRVRHVLTEKVKRSCRDHPDQVLADLLPLIEPEIEKLIRIELINDERLGQQLVESWRGRGVSARMIGIRLQKKGFDRTQITKLVAQDSSQDTQDQERDAALRYLKRRKLPPFIDLSALDRETALKLRSRAYAALARQGYDADLIAEVIKSSPN